jgi:hypothetical protein
MEMVFERIARLTATLDRALSFSRTRNSDGEFAPQAEDGPDPNAMARAYGAPETGQSGLKVAATVGGAGALTAAALLARKLRGRMRSA